MGDVEKKDEGGPAFPGEGYYGMTMRRYYAGLAMQGFCSAGPWPEIVTIETVAGLSVKFADALIAELKK